MNVLPFKTHARGFETIKKYWGQGFLAAPYSPHEGCILIIVSRRESRGGMGVVVVSLTNTSQIDNFQSNYSALSMELEDRLKMSLEIERGTKLTELSGLSSQEDEEVTLKLE